jgi:hypothetical protein
MNNKKYIICSAIYFDDNEIHPSQPNNIKTGLVVCGLRHHNCFSIANLIFKHHEYKGVQGFVTSDNLFLNREDAYKYAIENGQIKKDLIRNVLTSDDLY